MAVQGIRGVVEAAIQRASQATGVDFSFLMRTANRESGYNPAAKAATSSAAGLFQFTEQTWLATLKAHGSKYGYARYADLITRGNDGRYRVAGDDARKAVMNLRFDPHAASLMVGEMTTDNAAYLAGRIGRQPSAGELYAAHFLGPQGSARLITATRDTPGATAASLFPDAAAASRFWVPCLLRKSCSQQVRHVAKMIGGIDDISLSPWNPARKLSDGNI